MRKLALRLDDLSVESFETRAPAAERGTVQGRWDDSSWCSYGNDGNFTGCDLTCYEPCGPSEHCTPACPPGGTQSCGCNTQDQSCDTLCAMSCGTGCDFSCEFAC
jgi:hypothetical protein